MDPKQDQKMLLGLSYYSNSMLQTLLIDSCMTFIITKSMANLKTPVMIDYITAQITNFLNIFDHEFFKRQTPRPVDELIKVRLDCLAQLGEITIENGVVKQMLYTQA